MFDLEDDERRLLARELYDTIAQNVAALIMDLGLIVERHGQEFPSDVHADLSECLSLARQNLHQIVMFCHKLYPPMIDELGLPASLRIYIEGFSRSTGMRVELEVPDSYARLPNELEVTLFRVVREGLTSARQHFNSSWANVRMSARATEARATVEDELAIDPSLREAARHSVEMEIGIRGIQERVQQLGGQIAFHSDEYRTVIEAVLPLSRASSATSS